MILALHFSLIGMYIFSSFSIYVWHMYVKQSENWQLWGKIFDPNCIKTLKKDWLSPQSVLWCVQNIKCHPWWFGTFFYLGCLQTLCLWIVAKFEVMQWEPYHEMKLCHTHNLLVALTYSLHAISDKWKSMTDFDSLVIQTWKYAHTLCKLWHFLLTCNTDKQHHRSPFSGIHNFSRQLISFL